MAYATSLTTTRAFFGPETSGCGLLWTGRISTGLRGEEGTCLSCSSATSLLRGVDGWLSFGRVFRPDCSSSCSSSASSPRTLCVSEVSSSPADALLLLWVLFDSDGLSSTVLIVALGSRSSWGGELEGAS